MFFFADLVYTISVTLGYIPNSHFHFLSLSFSTPVTTTTPAYRNTLGSPTPSFSHPVKQSLSVSLALTADWGYIQVESPVEFAYALSTRCEGNTGEGYNTRRFSTLPLSLSRCFRDAHTQTSLTKLSPTPIGSWPVSRSYRISLSCFSVSPRHNTHLGFFVSVSPDRGTLFAGEILLDHRESNECYRALLGTHKKCTSSVEKSIVVFCG